MTGKRFILGVGAQKAGTTWLHDYLAGHPDVAMPTMKELHYFDTKYLPKLFWRKQESRIDRLKKIRKQEVLKGKSGAEDRIKSLYWRLRMEFDPQDYIRFFEEISRARSVTGDITPSYSMLPVEGFREARDVLTSAGFEVRVIFLMRDPIERAYSALRMADRNKGQNYAFDHFFQALERKALVARTRYDLVLDNLGKVFPENEVHVEFYESLFTPEAVARICEFLGIDVIEPHFDVRKNASAKNAELDRARINAGLAKFRPVYDHVRKTFGDRVPAEWHA